MEEKKFSKFRAFLFGSGEIYGSGAFLMISTLFFTYLITVAKLDPALAGTIPLLGKIFDAITDPIMGVISDKYDLCFGRRRTYFLFGSFFVAISFFMLWYGFGISTTINKYIYYLFSYLLFSAAFTIVMIPYNAIVPEMTSDYNNRTLIITYRNIFSVIGSILVGVGPGIIFAKVPDRPVLAFVLIGLAFSLLFGIVWIIVFFASYENKTKVQESQTIKEAFVGFKTMFHNKSFLDYLKLYLTGQGAGDLVLATVVIYLGAVINKANSYGLVIGILVGMQIIALPIYYKIANKYSKTKPLKIGVPLLTFGLALAFLLRENTNDILLIVVSIFCGFGVTGFIYTTSLMFPDLADIDELITSRRREGAYAGVATFIRKLISGLIMGGLGIALSFIGYDANLVQQSPFTIFGIKIIFCVIPVVLMLISYSVTKRYKITEQTYKVLKKELDYRNLHDGRSNASVEEKEICEEITGLDFDELWGNEKEK